MKIVERDNEVVYYQQHETINQPLQLQINIEWLTLAKQKQALLKQIWEQPDHELWGLINFLDFLQDTGVQQGLPVVFTKEEDTPCPTKSS